MSVLRNKSKWLFLAAMLISISCTQENPISAVVAKAEAKAKLQQDGNIKKLNFGVPNMSLNKITSASKWMMPENGGYLQLFHLGDDTTDFMFVYSLLMIQPNTMSDSAEIGLTVDDENFAGACDIEFAPHGINFSSPALLTLYAYGLDLSGVDVESLAFYYDNQDTGEWEKMNHAYLYADTTIGLLYINGAELPHFSRYAIGTE